MGFDRLRSGRPTFNDVCVQRSLRKEFNSFEFRRLIVEYIDEFVPMILRFVPDRTRLSAYSGNDPAHPL